MGICLECESETTEKCARCGEYLCARCALTDPDDKPVCPDCYAKGESD